MLASKVLQPFFIYPVHVLLCIPSPSLKRLSSMDFCRSLQKPSGSSNEEGYGWIPADLPVTANSVLAAGSSSFKSLCHRTLKSIRGRIDDKRWDHHTGLPGFQVCLPGAEGWTAKREATAAVSFDQMHDVDRYLPQIPSSQIPSQVLKFLKHDVNLPHLIFTQGFIDRDVSSQFRALSFALRGTVDEYNTVRNAIVEKMQDSTIFDQSIPHLSRAFHKFEIQHAQRPGDQVTLAIAATVFQRNIIILSLPPTGPPFFSSFGDSGWQGLAMLRQGTHYELLFNIKSC